MIVLEEDNHKLGSQMISYILCEIIEVDRSMIASTIITGINQLWDTLLDTKKAWLRKKIDIEKVHGNWEELYQKLPFF